MSIRRTKPKFPSYEWDSKSPNPFSWIIRTADELRAKRQAEREREYLRVVERRAPERWRL